MANLVHVEAFTQRRPKEWDISIREYEQQQNSVRQ